MVNNQLKKMIYKLLLYLMVQQPFKLRALQQLDLGYNYRITDIQCALGVNQMKKLDRYLKRRKEIAARYDEAFADIDNIIRPYQSPDGEGLF